MMIDLENDTNVKKNWFDLYSQGQPSTGFPPTWTVSESQGKSGNLGGQGKSRKIQGILDVVREKEEKKKKREMNKRSKIKKNAKYDI